MSYLELVYLNTGCGVCVYCLVLLHLLLDEILSSILGRFLASVHTIYCVSVDNYIDIVRVGVAAFLSTAIVCWCCVLDLDERTGVFFLFHYQAVKKITSDNPNGPDVIVQLLVQSTF